jgi:hypothetical protein
MAAALVKGAIHGGSMSTTSCTTQQTTHEAERFMKNVNKKKAVKASSRNRRGSAEVERVGEVGKAAPQK